MAFAPVYSFQGGAEGPARVIGKDAVTFVPTTITFGGSDTYVTGGMTITLPDEVSDFKFEGILITKGNDGTRRWDWNGSRTAPKLLAYDAFVTEEGNATSIASIVLEVILVLKR